MIVVPVKTDKENPAVSPLFGKAKFFALLKDGEKKIVKNEHQNGREIASWLVEIGAKKLIIAHMGRSPFDMIRDSGIEIYFAGANRIELDSAVAKCISKELVLINHENFDEFLKESDHK